jgi:hypothetical protein
VAKGTPSCQNQSPEETQTSIASQKRLQSSNPDRGPKALRSRTSCHDLQDQEDLSFVLAIEGDTLVDEITVIVFAVEIRKLMYLATGLARPKWTALTACLQSTWSIPLILALIDDGVEATSKRMRRDEQEIFGSSRKSLALPDLIYGYPGPSKMSPT